jgi:hypothetical protein
MDATYLIFQVWTTDKLGMLGREVALAYFLLGKAVEIE